jgi:uncharacterized membrane protein YtjA (UPF0391 family)
MKWRRGFPCPAHAGRIREKRDKDGEERRGAMLSWALVFFIVAVISGVLGFTGIAAAATEIAKILFFIFLVLFVVSLIFGSIRRPKA